MNQKLDIADVINRELKKASKQRNATMYLYYKQLQDNNNLVAFTIYNQFKGSWAYHQWYNRYKDDINDIVAMNARRFGEIWSAI